MNTYNFGDFQIVMSRRLLLRNGEPLTVTPKVFDLLLLLVQNACCVLAKDDILKAIWPDTVAAENNLYVAISTLRRILEDSPLQKRFIETVPGTGYKFCYPATAAPELLEPSEPVVVPTPPPSKASWSVPHLLASRTPHKIALALALGTVVLSLSVNRSLVGRMSVLTTPPAASALSAAASPKLSARLAPNPRAFQSYIKGRYAWNRRTAKEVAKSIHYFEESAREDPAFALAKVGLADAYYSQAMFDSAAIPPRRSYEQARKAALAAVALDGSLAEPYATLGSIALNFQWDLPQSEKYFRKALSLNPNSSVAHQRFAWLLLAKHRDLEAEAEMKTAQQLDPLGLNTNTNVGLLYYCEHHYEAAETQLKATLDMDSKYGRAHVELARTYIAEQRWKDAIAELAFSRVALGDTTEITAALGYALSRAGNQVAARALLTDLERRSRHQFVSSYHLALLHAGLGETDQAFVRLRQSLEERSLWIPWLRSDTRLDALRADPRFKDLTLLDDPVQVPKAPNLLAKETNPHGPPTKE